jgi:O-methyltransferase
MSASSHDRRLQIPGFRRYALEIERLRRAAGQRDELRDKLAAVERELNTLRASRGLGAGSEPAPEDAEWLADAKRFEYYWLNANKKIDLLEMRPFGDVARAVMRDGRSFLNADRLYTLWQAVTGMPANAAAVAEVGVFKGGSAKLIAEALRASGRPVPFYACDTFSGHTVVDEALDGRHKVNKQFRTVAAKVVGYLKQYDFLEVIEGDIRDTAARFTDQYAFGMVHVDVDVYPITAFCLEFFAPRMVTGAMIVVDDYGFITCRGAKQAVDEFAAANSSRFRAMHLLTGQAILMRVS